MSHVSRPPSLVQRLATNFSRKKFSRDFLEFLTSHFHHVFLSNVGFLGEHVGKMLSKFKMDRDGLEIITPPDFERATRHTRKKSLPDCNCGRIRCKLCQEIKKWKERKARKSTFSTPGYESAAELLLVKEEPADSESGEKHFTTLLLQSKLVPFPTSFNKGLHLKLNCRVWEQSQWRWAAWFGWRGGNHQGF